MCYGRQGPDAGKGDYRAWEKQTLNSDVHLRWPGRTGGNAQGADPQATSGLRKQHNTLSKHSLMVDGKRTVASTSHLTTFSKRKSRVDSAKPNLGKRPEESKATSQWSNKMDSAKSRQSCLASGKHSLARGS